MTDSQQALHEIKQMKADRYFLNGVQGDFVAAIGRGELERAQRLLGEGADVNAVGGEGMTALYWAIAKQSLPGFRFLLEGGGDPNTLTRWTDSDGAERWASVIEMAAMLEDSRYLTALLDAGANPDQIVNSVGETAIFTALLHERFENASLLIEKGADINHRAQAQITPINRSVSGRAYASALFLLKAGADPTIKNRWGYSAVDTARQFGNAGTLIGSENEAAYPEFVAELKRRELWGE